MTNSKILNLVLNLHRPKEARTANSRFAIAGLKCFYDSEVPNSSFVHLLKFSAENPRTSPILFPLYTIPNEQKTSDFTGIFRKFDRILRLKNMFNTIEIDRTNLTIMGV